MIRCPRWPAAAGGGGDLVRGGPRAAAGSGPRVATAGGPAGEPVLQVAPGPAPGSGALGRRRTRGPRWPLPAARRVNRFCRWLPARRRAQGPGWPPVGGPVLRVAPRAGAGIRCPGSSTNSGPKVASGGGWGGDLVRGGPRAAAGSGPRVATVGGCAGDPVGRWPPGGGRDLVPRVADELGAQGGNCRRPGG